MAPNQVEDAPRGNKIATVVKFVLFLGLGIFIIWLSLRGLTTAEKDQILHSFRIANYNWVILTVFLGIFSHILRALRWKLLLEPMNYHPTVKNIFYAVMVGYFANLAFPRLGEVTRCGILNRYEKIPFNKSFGTVITERAIDMIMFFLLFIIMIATQAGTIGHYMSTNIYPKFADKFHNQAFSLIFLVVTVVSVLFAGFLIYIFRKKITSSGLFVKVKQLIIGFWDGLKSLSQIKNPGLFVFYSLSIWALYYFMLFLIFLCFNETSALGLGSGLSALVLGSVGIMVTPGGIGLYPAIIQETLMLYGVTKPIGLALGWIAWTAQTGMILVVGGLSLLLLSFNKQPNGKP